jgi:hypothetical protein
VSPLKKTKKTNGPVEAGCIDRVYGWHGITSNLNSVRYIQRAIEGNRLCVISKVSHTMREVEPMSLEPAGKSEAGWMLVNRARRR